jgi:signal transduction histidine kinase
VRSPIPILISSAGLGLGVAVAPLSLAAGRELVAVTDIFTGAALFALAGTAWNRYRAVAVLATATGLTWYLGSVLEVALFWHRGPLLHLLAAFPAARPRSRLSAVIIAGGYVAAVILPAWRNDVSAAILALAFAAALLVDFAGMRSSVPRTARQGLAAALMLLAVIFGTAAGRSLAGSGGGILPALLIYEAGIVIAVGMLIAALRRDSADLTDLIIDLRRSGPLFTDLESVGDLAGQKQLAGLPAYSEAAVVAARLVAENNRLRSEQLRWLRGAERARRRILVAADLEQARLRSQLERTLLDPLRSVHDSLAQQQHSSGSPALAPVLAAVERSIRSLEQAARGLRPPELDGGLRPALEEATSSVPFTVHLDLPLIRLEPSGESALYFAATEAVANAVKHSGATALWIRLAEADGTVEVTVADDGRGGADLARGTGLRGVAERVQALGGSLRVSSPVGRGTRVSIRMPRAHRGAHPD